MVSDTFRLAYGREAGDLLRVLAQEFVRNGRVGALIATDDPFVENWLDNPYGFDQARRAVMHLLERLRPPGDPNLPTANAASAAKLEQMSANSVDSTLAAIQDPHWGEQFPDNARSLDLEELAAEVRATLRRRIDQRAT